MQAVYLLPGADFRGYTKIMLDPTEVDFVKGWVKETNQNFGFAYGRTDDQDAKDIAKEVRKGFDKVFAEAFTKAGWQVVTEPAPDVLRLSTAVFNLSISAPSSVTMSPGCLGADGERRPGFGADRGAGFGVRPGAGPSPRCAHRRRHRQLHGPHTQRELR